MKIIRMEWQQRARYGLLQGDDVYALAGDLLGDFSAGKKLSTLSEAKLLPLVEGKVVPCVAANYFSLLNGMGREIPPEPQVFLKPPSTLVGHLDAIIHPPDSSHVSVGGELAVVMGREARHVPEDLALDYVLGYTCALDVTAFDWLSERFPTRAKGYYSFCPLGPCIDTAVTGDNLMIRSRLNGSLLFDHSTSDMIFSVARSISYISRFMTLEPLQVVLLGTPIPETKVNVGDRVEVEITGIGTLINPIHASAGSKR